MKKILLLLMLICLLVSCSKKDAGGAKAAGEVTRISVNETSEPKAIDTVLANEQSASAVNSLVSEGLAKIGKDGSPEPGLAEKWEVSEDGLKWTFHLREGIKWSNGEPITAEDFRYAWLRALDPKTASTNAYMLYAIKGAEAYNADQGSREDVGIKVVDDKTLEVNLEKPTAYFPSLVSYVTFSPVNQKYFESMGDKYALEVENMMYSGPYVITEWVHNSHFLMKKNENYWNKNNIKIDEIELKLISDSAAELNAFNNDEVDLIRLTAEQYANYENDERVHVFKNNSVWYIEFNVKDSFLSNKKIRQAISMAVDKEKLTSTIIKGTGEAAYGIVPTGFKGYEKTFREEAGDAYPRFDAAKAKTLYEEGLKELGLAKAPTLSVLINDSGNNKKIAEYIQEELRVNLGLDIKIEVLPFKEKVSRTEQRDFQMAISGWSADYLDPIAYIELFETKSGNNHSSFSNAKYDELIKVITNSNDNKVRMEAMKEAEKILADEVPIAPFSYSTRIAMLNPRVKNVYFRGMGSEFYLLEAYVEK